MVKMIATKPITYDMKTVNAGDEFEVADQHVGVLVSLGRASPKDAAGTKVEPVTTKPKEDPKPAKAAEAEDAGKYRTRQVKAEGDK